MKNLKKNIFNNIPNEIPEELIQVLFEADTIRVERIISRGHSSPQDFWYDQVNDEFVILLKGSAGLCFEDNMEILILKPGDYIHIKKHIRHRVEWTDPKEDTVWLAIHF